MEKGYFYIGKVTDNQDEDKLGRVKVTRAVGEDVVSDWLPCLSPVAGSDAGFFTIPEVDDCVLVLALGDAANTQVVVGEMWNDGAAPPETGENSDADLNGDGKNSLRFFKSRAGSMIVFDDTDGKEKIQILASEGNTRFELDAGEEVMNIETDKDFALSAKGKIAISTEDELSVESKKAMSVECDDFAVKASKDSSLEASKDMTLKGSGIALN